MGKECRDDTFNRIDVRAGSIAVSVGAEEAAVRQLSGGLRTVSAGLEGFVIRG